MKLDDFYYKLDEQLIAQHPLHRRDKARLMVINRKEKTLNHDVFSNIGKYLPRQSLIVLNDSKVIPARLLGKRKNGGKVEVFLLKKLNDDYTYQCLLRPLKRIQIDEPLSFNGGNLIARLKSVEGRVVRFNKRNISRFLERHGHMPLPPYIKRPDRAEDTKYYQTVYAKRPGSVAAPTAGLHFTTARLKKLEKDGHKIEKVTLHVNYATFKPVEEKDITKHKMHSEEYYVTKKTFVNIQKSKKAGKKIIAVGTTSCRVLETMAVNNRLSGITDIFIYPGYKFKMVDVLITNFHLPFSTLLMLVYAFGGQQLMKEAYQEAINKNYRFYSYGDGMVIL